MYRSLVNPFFGSSFNSVVVIRSAPGDFFEESCCISCRSSVDVIGLLGTHSGMGEFRNCRKIPDTNFSWRLNRSQRHTAAGRIRTTEKSRWKSNPRPSGLKHIA
jgi:hypothetical protein